MLTNHYKDTQMKTSAQLHTITCPNASAALKLSLVLEHEGSPSVWFLVDGRATVHTMAPTHTVRNAISMFVKEAA